MEVVQRSNKKSHLFANGSPPSDEDVLKQIRQGAHDAMLEYLVDLGFDCKEAVVKALIEFARAASHEPGAKEKAQEPTKPKPRNSQRKWTDKELDTLRRMYPEFLNAYIAEVLGRSEDACRYKAMDMGLRKVVPFSQQAAPRDWKPKEESNA